MPQKKPKNLKEALVEEAYSLIEENGVEKLSLRDVARRLGVSHQAPYKHFASRDHILAAVVSRCFSNFAAHLEERPVHDDPFEDLGAMGMAYLEFARMNPLQYRLMFNSPLPDVSVHSDMMDQAQKAFSILRDKLARMQLRPLHHEIQDPAKHDAMFVWSALHGLASLLQSDVTKTVGWSETDSKTAVERTMRRLGAALHDVD